MAHDLFAGGAGADDEGAMIVELAEDALGEFDSGEGDGDGARADFGFVADALADFEGALEHAVEDGSGFAVIEGDLIGVADLAEDFGFAEEHGIESGGDAEQMADGVGVAMAVERAVQFAGGHLVIGGEEEFHGRGGVGGLLDGNAVEFAAVAGGEDHGFFEDAAGAELFGGFAGLFGAEGDAFAQLDGGGAVA